MKDSPKKPERRDEIPLAGTPEAQPAAPGTGVILGGLAGFAAGTVLGGPVGTTAGPSMVAGAMAGGFIGGMAGEKIDPDQEDTYWREHHPLEPYATGRPYEEFEPAYRSGYEGYSRHGGNKFSEVEADIQRDYESFSVTLPWSKARPAAEAAWRRVYEHRASGVDRQ